MSVADKVQSRHCDRLAIVYVRQSTLQQVERHQESTRLQYGLVERALQFGWSRERVVVIDDDLGRSGAAAAMNPGFQRLVAEVGLGRVGLVLGVEMSRLARSCRDWHQLLEICAVFDTLLADTDGVYDPGFYNDRLLLGLKGTMSEAELHLLKGRMLAAAPRPSAASCSSICRAATFARPPARSPPIPTSRCRRRSGWCSTSSSDVAQSMACCAISSITRFTCPIVSAPARRGASWNGTARTATRSRRCCATRSMQALIPTVGAP